MTTERMTEAGFDALLRDLWRGDLSRQTHGEQLTRLRHEAVRARRAELAKDAEIQRLRAKLKPFAEFARRFNLRPIPNTERADILYGIHAGEKDLEADIHLSDCRSALKALE